MTKKRKRFISIAVLVICAIIVYFFVSSMVTISKLKKESAEIEKTLENLQQQKEALELTLENITSDEFIEELARLNLKLIKRGELLFIVEDTGDNDSGENEKGESANDAP